VESECLPFHAIPHSSRLFLDYLSYAERVRKYYPHPPLAVERLLSAESGDYPGDRRQQLAAVLERQNREWGPTRETLDNIGRLGDGAAAVVTGQQVALFGGPLFSLLKALTTVKLAAHLAQSGRPAVPVFWLATADHDLEEVNHAKLPAGGELRLLRTASAGAENAPVSSVRLAGDVAELLQEAAALLGESEVTDLLRSSYRSGETLGGAFARLFSRLFGKHGVVLVDGSDPELNRLAQPIYRQALLKSAELGGALLERGHDLEADGYHAQVRVTPSSTLLFVLREGGRVPLRRGNGGLTLGAKQLSVSDVERELDAHPENFSANVLLRPVVQDYLLPTLAYVGGPSEVAYFAQVAVVYQGLLGRVTPILPRLSATLVEAPTQRLLKRYGNLSLSDIFPGPEHLRELLASRRLPSDTLQRFQSAEQALEELLHDIRNSLERLDPTLVQAAAKSGAKMRYQLERLKMRAARAELRRNQELARHADELAALLYPNKNLQEREIAGIYFLARHGTQLLDRLLEWTQISCPDHQVVYLGSQ